METSFHSFTSDVIIYHLLITMYDSLNNMHVTFDINIYNMIYSIQFVQPKVTTQPI